MGLKESNQTNKAASEERVNTHNIWASTWDFVLITFVQKPPLKAHADLSSRARGTNLIWVVIFIHN